MEIVRGHGVSISGDNVAGDDVAVVVDRGHSGRAGTSVGVDAESEDWVVLDSHTQYTRAHLAQTAANG